MANNNSLIAQGIRAINNPGMSLFVILLCQIIRWPTSTIGDQMVANEKVMGRTVVRRTRHGRNAFWAAMVYRPRKGGYVKRINWHHE